jgi:ADP-ribose pyrophosphatase YjhB (NUDIX family)
MPLPPRLYRLAWLARTAWQLVTRPRTIGVRVIVEREGRVLLIRHSYVPGWHLPGGGVDRGETLAEAARREVREEVGLTVEVDPQPFGVYGRFQYGASDHVAVFVARRVEGEPLPDQGEIAEAGFFDPDALPGDTTPATRQRLSEHRARSPRAERW